MVPIRRRNTGCGIKGPARMRWLEDLSAISGTFPRRGGCSSAAPRRRSVLSGAVPQGPGGLGARRAAGTGMKRLPGTSPQTHSERWRLRVELRRPALRAGPYLLCAARLRARLGRSPSPGSTRRTRCAGPGGPRGVEAHGVDPTGRGDGGILDEGDDPHPTATSRRGQGIGGIDPGDESRPGAAASLDELALLGAVGLIGPRTKSRGFPWVALGRSPSPARVPPHRITEAGRSDGRRMTRARPGSEGRSSVHGRPVACGCAGMAGASATSECIRARAIEGHR